MPSEIAVFGRSRRRIGSGRGLPVELTATSTVSSMRVRGRAAPNCCSSTWPNIVTWSPTTGNGESVLRSSTKIPSEVAGSPSPAGSCIHMSRPLAVMRVTTPVVRTKLPTTGESCPGPWISMIVNDVAEPAVAVPALKMSESVTAPASAAEICGLMIASLFAMDRPTCAPTRITKGNSRGFPWSMTKVFMSTA